jgi:hypothetical protein
MANTSMDIEYHGTTNEDLQKENVDVNLQLYSKYTIQNMQGKSVYAIAHPGNIYDAQAINFVRSAGYILGFTCVKSIDHKPNVTLTISRMPIYTDFENFKNRLSRIWEYPANYSNLHSVKY